MRAKLATEMLSSIKIRPARGVRGISRAVMCPLPFFGVLSAATGLSWKSILACRICACVVLLTAGIWIAAECPANAQQSASEYQVKAAYLFNFLKFVEWPGQSPGDTPGPWLICVVGENPFGSDLAQVISGKSVQGHELQIKDSLAPGDLHACHILFVSASERKRLPAILAALKGSSTLTVGDMENFTGSGGMIQFIEEDGRVRFVINAGAASGAGLKVSSKLLSLAQSVTGTEGSAKN
jgi:hypothetical protein